MKDIGFYKNGIEQGWTVEKSSYQKEEERGDETIFTLSNGYLGIRGSLEISSANKDAATFIAGLYDKDEAPSVGPAKRGYVKNKAITPAYATVPDANLMEISSGDIPFDFINCKVLSFFRTLDLKRGILFNEYSLENAEGKAIEVKTMTVASKINRHDVLRKIEVKALNFDGEIAVRLKNSLCDKPKTIRRLKDYVVKSELVRADYENGACLLEAEIGETKDRVLLLAVTEGEDNPFVMRTETGIDEVFKLQVHKGERHSFCKRFAYYTTHDCLEQARLCAMKEEDFIEEQIHAWAKAWEISDVAIEGDDEIQQGLRWNIFNLMQLAFEGNDDISISATGLHGQGYFGHIFWDTEIFMLPFYLATDPEEAKSLLRYRYKRLAQAKEVARKEGCDGAKFPWTSAYTGNDVTPPDWAESSNREIHIAGAVAYGMHNYYEQTGDEDFYKECGIETVIETAKYYMTRATYGQDGKFHLEDVTGPDEYNIHVTDNYYTNYLAVWNMREAVRATEELRRTDTLACKRIVSATGFDDKYREKMLYVADNMAFPRVRNHVCEQFKGFFDLKDLQIERDEFGMPKDRTRVFDSGLQELKQPDVVMLHFLFPNDFPKEMQAACFEYYEKRCKHGSSLSPSVHCIVGLRNGFDAYAYSYLYLTALLDLKDMHMDKNLYEGIHIACAGGTWCAAVYGFGGVCSRNGELHIDPQLPEKWNKLSYKLIYRQIQYAVTVGKGSFAVTASADTNIFYKEKSYALRAGERRVFGE